MRYIHLIMTLIYIMAYYGASVVIKTTPGVFFWNLSLPWQARGAKSQVHGERLLGVQLLKGGNR